MVDFVKIYTWSKGIRLIEWLDFTTEVSRKTGEASEFEIAKWNNLNLKSYDNGRLEITGSLHKFANSGFHNHDLFSQQRVVLTINHLCQELRLNPVKCNLVNIEFGLNLGFNNPNEVLRSLISHRNEPFNSQHHGYYRECEKDEYYIKCYNKSQQFNLSRGILRFELKFKRSRQISRFGIKTLSDLTSTHWVSPIINELHKVWCELLFVDRSVIKNSDLHLTSQDYWSPLPKKQRQRQYRKYKKRYGVDLQSKVRDRIRESHQFILQV